MVQLKKYLIMNIKTALAILVWITSVITTGILVQNTKTDNIIVEEIITICDKEKDSLTMEENIYLYLDSINLNPKVNELSKIKKPNGKLMTEDEFKKSLNKITENLIKRRITFPGNTPDTKF
jgi:hypothetical protein